MFNRNISGSRHLGLHTADFEAASSSTPILLNGKKFPINRLDTGALTVTNTSATLLDPDGSSYPILTTNTELVVKIDEADAAEVKLKEGFPVVIGNQFFKKQSPAPFAFAGVDGKLNCLVLSNAIFSDSIMGWAGRGKPDAYSQGLVRPGSSNHNNLFLRKDGNWGLPSAHTGSVSSHLISLADFPNDYTGNVDKYLRVSYAEGGSIVFDAIDTSKVSEGLTNLYYTEERANASIIAKTGDRSLNTISVIDTITAKEFIADSDQRLKCNIEPLSNSLDKVLQLSPKTYRFLDGPKTHFGLIAQSVNTIIPEIVSDNGFNKGINYLELIPFLIGSIQTLSNQVTELESAMRELGSQ